MLYYNMQKGFLTKIMTEGFTAAEFFAMTNAVNLPVVRAAFLEGLSIFHFGYPPLCRAMALEDGRELKKLFQHCHTRGILISLDLSLPSPGTFSHDLDWGHCCGMYCRKPIFSARAWRRSALC